MTITRSRTKRKHFDENSCDESVVDPKLKFKIDTYFGTLDALIMAIENRFNSTAQNILRNISFCSKNCLNQVKNGKLPADMFCTFCSLYQFIDRNKLCIEYTQYSNVYSDFEKITKLPKNIYPFTSNNNTFDIESNIEISTSDEELNNDQTQKNI